MGRPALPGLAKQIESLPFRPVTLPQAGRAPTTLFRGSLHPQDMARATDNPLSGFHASPNPQVAAMYGRIPAYPSPGGRTTSVVSQFRAAPEQLYHAHEQFRAGKPGQTFAQIARDHVDPRGFGVDPLRHPQMRDVGVWPDQLQRTGFMRETATAPGQFSHEFAAAPQTPQWAGIRRQIGRSMPAPPPPRSSPRPTPAPQSSSVPEVDWNAI